MARRLARLPRKAQAQRFHLTPTRHPLPTNPTTSSRKKKSPPPANLAALCEAYAEEVSGNNHYARAALELAQLVGRNPAWSLTGLQLNSLVARWRQSLSPATAHYRRRGLVALTRHLEAHGAAQGLHRAIQRLRAPQPRRTIATREDLARLVALAPAWLRVILLLALQAGMRRGDTLRISAANVDTARGLVVWPMQKTGTTHTLPLTPDLAALFNAAPPETYPGEPFVHRYHNHRPISTTALNQAWWRLKERAGVNRDLWIHDLRRTAAELLYLLTRDIRTVAHLLGHNHLATTAQYLAHRDPATLRPLLEQMWTPTQVPQ